MNTILAAPNHLILNFYSAYLEMIDLEHEQYSSISVAMKRASLIHDIINVFIVLETREDFSAYSKQKENIDENSKNLILICMKDEILRMATSSKVITFSHKDITNELVSTLSGISVCKPYMQESTSDNSPEKILEHIKFMLLKGKINLPVKNEYAITVLSSLESDDISFKAIDEMTKNDPVLHSGIIKMANSAYFSGAFSNVTDVEKAMVRVGLANVKVFLINFINKSLASNSDLLYAKEICNLVDESLKVGCLCYVMADCFKVTSPVTMFSIGLMSQLGKIFMYASISDYLAGQKLSEDEKVCYSDMVESNGMKVSGMLLKKWKMSEDYYTPVIHGKELEHNPFMNETRILYMAINMINFYDTGAIDDDIYNMLNKCHICLEDNHLKKIRVDSVEHYKKLSSVLS